MVGMMGLRRLTAAAVPLLVARCADSLGGLVLV